MNMKMLQELCTPLCDGDAALSKLFRECARKASSRGDLPDFDTVALCFFPTFEVFDDSDRARVDNVSCRFGDFLEFFSCVGAETSAADVVDIVPCREGLVSLPLCSGLFADSAPATVGTLLCLCRCAFRELGAPGELSILVAKDGGSSTITVG